jgi:hypothetical protein
MRSIGDLVVFTLSLGGASFLLAAGLAYAFATSALRGAGILLFGALAVGGVLLLVTSLNASSSECGECEIFYFFVALQVVGWLVGAVLGWGLRWVFRR